MQSILRKMSEKKGDGLTPIQYFFGALLGFVLSTLMQVLVMTNGWGLAPVNWWWIIGVGVFGAGFLRVLLTKVLVRPKHDDD